MNPIDFYILNFGNVNFKFLKSSDHLFISEYGCMVFINNILYEKDISNYIDELSKLINIPGNELVTYFFVNREIVFSAHYLIGFKVYAKINPLFNIYIETWINEILEFVKLLVSGNKFIINKEISKLRETNPYILFNTKLIRDNMFYLDELGIKNILKLYMSKFKL
jgi:hypothetical protein